jgi:hypothetical protein
LPIRRRPCRPATPKIAIEMLKMAASNAAHLAKVLKTENYPGVEG